MFYVNIIGRIPQLKTHLLVKNAGGRLKMTVKPNLKESGAGVEKNDIDFSIDVRYEEDVIKAFNKFIKKWCGKYYSHLIDSDEQDGQFMREKIEDAISQAVAQAREEVIEDVRNLLDEYNEMDDNAMQFELRIRKPIEFAKALQSLSAIATVQDTECECCCHGVDDPDCQYNDCIHCSKQGEDDNGKK